MTSNIRIQPEDIVRPYGNYNHGVEIQPGSRILYISGQVGAEPDGTIPDAADAQMAVIFDNITRVLQAANMDFGDIVKLNFFVVDKDDLPAIRRVRDNFLTAPFPAMSLILVPALGRPEWRLEVDGVAARST